MTTLLLALWGLLAPVIANAGGIGGGGDEGGACAICPATGGTAGPAGPAGPAGGAGPAGPVGVSTATYPTLGAFWSADTGNGLPNGATFTAYTPTGEVTLRSMTLAVQDAATLTGSVTIICGDGVNDLAASFTSANDRGLVSVAGAAVIPAGSPINCRMQYTGNDLTSFQATIEYQSGSGGGGSAPVGFTGAVTINAPAGANGGVLTVSDNAAQSEIIFTSNSITFQTVVGDVPATIFVSTTDGAFHFVSSGTESVAFSSKTVSIGSGLTLGQIQQAASGFGYQKNIVIGDPNSDNTALFLNTGGTSVINGAPGKLIIQNTVDSKALCINSSNRLSACTSAVGPSGGCTCP